MVGNCTSGGLFIGLSLPLDMAQLPGLLPLGVKGVNFGLLTGLHSFNDRGRGYTFCERGARCGLGVLSLTHDYSV